MIDESLVDAVLRLRKKQLSFEQISLELGISKDQAKYIVHRSEKQKTRFCIECGEEIDYEADSIVSKGYSDNAYSGMRRFISNTCQDCKEERCQVYADPCRYSA